MTIQEIHKSLIDNILKTRIFEYHQLKDKTIIESLNVSFFIDLNKDLYQDNSIKQYEELNDYLLNRYEILNKYALKASQTLNINIKSNDCVFTHIDKKDESNVTLFHFLVRNDISYINILISKLNYETEMLYSLETFILLANSFKANFNLANVIINITTTSFYKLI